MPPPLGPQNPPSSRPASLNVAAARLGWNPRTELLLQTHLRFKQTFLEACKGNNQEAMILLQDQAITTHNSLKQLISREILLSLTEGWNPHVTHPNHPANRQPNNPASIPSQRTRGQNPPAASVCQQAPPPAPPANGPQGAAQQAAQTRPGQNGPGQNGCMRGRRNYRTSIYEELFCMSQTIQGGYQAIDQSRTQNQGPR
ncbi:hypothetical protein PTTG_30664 [Puccinia triticina 1-1 BBBD Race 1]|uniref:Uncharacterized protein n=1 Tax=Puccinia triticina (isolate 1-1 / race 1 (BBBD)) TaxID=630390 RepID=A0A180FXX2_PUCT1|nr:hypothetical protein PTTG_30664 [Puccinia triticina 1-1 BBBD Race 1]